MTREEAIEVIKAKADYLESDKRFRAAVETIIPELAESEDEQALRIIKKRMCYDPDPISDEDRRIVENWLEKQKERNLIMANLPQLKEQKPAESISQLTVQGKGVYKICPRCKERMVRDDSMIYTSMPPQYRYECPKCGESECDTVMYDNPEMEEQKPNSTEDMPYITDEHFYEREPADSFKYKLAEYMTRCCTKKEGPYGYEYGISAESILKMAEEELLKRGVVQKPAEWSEEDETAFGDLMWCIERASKSAKDENDMGNIWFAENWVKNRLKSLRPNQPKQEWSEEDEERLELVIDCVYEYYPDPVMKYKLKDWIKSLPERFNLQPKQEWGEEDEACIRNLESIIYYDKKLPNDTRVILGEFLSNLRPQPKRDCKDCAMFLNGKCTKPHWKPSEVCYGPKGDPDPAGVWKPSKEQMEALKDAVKLFKETHFEKFHYKIESLYEQLKKLM